VLNSLTQDLQKEETDPNVDSELASIINTLITARGKTLRREEQKLIISSP